MHRSVENNAATTSIAFRRNATTNSQQGRIPTECEYWFYMSRFLPSDASLRDANSGLREMVPKRNLNPGGVKFKQNQEETNQIFG